MKYVGMIFGLGLIALSADPALAAKKQLARRIRGSGQRVLSGASLPVAQSGRPNIRISENRIWRVAVQVWLKPAEELKLIEDAIAAGASAIAVAPATDGIPALLKEKAGAIPIVTIAGDFSDADKSLRKSWVTSDDYAIGVALAGLVAKYKPDGGTICLQQNNPEAKNINARAAGVRDTLGGAAGTAALAGEKGWTEVKGCPLYNKDDPATANKQLTKLLAGNPKLDAVVLTGGWAMFDGKGLHQGGRQSEEAARQ